MWKGHQKEKTEESRLSKRSETFSQLKSSYQTEELNNWLPSNKKEKVHRKAQPWEILEHQEEREMPKYVQKGNYQSQTESQNRIRILYRKSGSLKKGKTHLQNYERI